MRRAQAPAQELSGAREPQVDRRRRDAEQARKADIAMPSIVVQEDDLSEGLGKTTDLLAEPLGLIFALDGSDLAARRISHDRDGTIDFAQAHRRPPHRCQPVERDPTGDASKPVRKPIRPVERRDPDETAKKRLLRKIFGYVGPPDERVTHRDHRRRPAAHDLIPRFYRTRTSPADEFLVGHAGHLERSADATKASAFW